MGSAKRLFKIKWEKGDLQKDNCYQLLNNIIRGGGRGGGEIHYNYYDNPLNIDQNIQTSYMNRSL